MTFSAIFGFAAMYTVTEEYFVHKKNFRPFCGPVLGTIVKKAQHKIEPGICLHFLNKFLKNLMSLKCANILYFHQHKNNIFSHVTQNEYIVQKWQNMNIMSKFGGK